MCLGGIRGADSRTRVRQAALPLLLLGATALSGQRVSVYSEFRRVDAAGEIVEQDRGGTPREIISPEVPRNGFASFRLVLKPPAGKQYTLFIGENPESIVQINLYREVQAKVGARSIPDRLEKITLPESGILPADVSAVTYWLDVWVPAHAPEKKRVRVEAQMNVGGDWTIYPMEMRIGIPILPKMELPAPPLPAPTAASSQFAFGALQSYLCGKPERTSPAAAATIRDLIRRNAMQDVALAIAIEPGMGKDAVQASIAALLGSPDVKSWCATRLASASTAPVQDPEHYLKIRDHLMRSAVK